MADDNNGILENVVNRSSFCRRQLVRAVPVDLHCPRNRRRGRRHRLPDWYRPGTSVDQTGAAISNSLIDTSNVLLNVLGLVQSIDGTLESIQNADSRGTALVTPQVNDINNSLIGAEQDLFNINLQLQETNRHLTNI